MNLADLYKQGKYDEVFILARFLYRNGYPTISDKAYDIIEAYMKEHNLLTDYTSRTYDDDPIPFDLLKKYNATHLIPDMVHTSKFGKYLDEDKSLSIRPVREYEDIWQFIQGAKDKDLVLSLKVDGVNTKTLYIDNNLELSMSRGRNDNGFDYTKGIIRILPTQLKTNEHELKIFSESFVLGSYLPVLRNKYNRDSFKTEKSSAISLLRVQRSDEDYKYLKSLAFSVEGALNTDTVVSRFEYLKANGFKTVPYVLIKYSSIPNDFDTFKIWFNKYCDVFYEKTRLIPSDGLVLEINDLNYELPTHNQYSDRNIAIKLNQWGFKRYEGIVKDIIIEQQKVNASCRVYIEPITTDDGCEAKVVNVYNPRILINENINIGSKIEFERNSGAINSLIYGERLNKF